MCGDSWALLDAHRKIYKWLIASAEVVTRCHFSECICFIFSKHFDFDVSELTISCFNMISLCWIGPFFSQVVLSHIFRSLLSRLWSLALYLVSLKIWNSFLKEGIAYGRLKSPISWGKKVRKNINLFFPYPLIIVTSNNKTVLKIHVFWSLFTMGARDGLLWH